ncbi:hypothetical protein [Burkholderia cenocepacia]|uniref:hypothetical protein n=1 Tax=Burkholderia cenocepacia TaxID=95486 RepID=UPI001F3CBE45|nr:hypothetical protein [Burkholderia cenocepacia]
MPRSWRSRAWRIRDALCSERELVALYVKTYPPASSPALDRKDARNSRLRVLARVGREVLAGVARTPTCGGQTVLQVSFENYDVFDRRIDDLLVAIALTAE